MKNTIAASGALPTGQFRWAIVLVLTSLASLCGLVVAAQQFVLKYLWDQSAHPRTIGGIGYMLMGIAGVCLPVLLLIKKRRFLALPPSRQSWLAFGVPILYVLVFAFCIEMSQRSTILVLPRPFTPTAVVRYDHRGTGVEFIGGWKESLDSSSSDARPANGVTRFSARLHQSFLRYPRRDTVTIVGRVERLDDGDVRILLDVDNQEPIRVDFENLAGHMVADDGPSYSQSVLQVGKHRFTIIGRPNGR
jgi:hypothetical protein